MLIHLEIMNRGLTTILRQVKIGGGSTWEPERGEQETSFGGRESQRTKLMKDYVKDLYKKLSVNIGETPEQLHYDYFKLEDGELYYRGKRKPLTLKALGFFLLVQHWGGCFPPPHVRLDPDILES